MCHDRIVYWQLINGYVEWIMRNTGYKEIETEIKIAKQQLHMLMILL